ncbi:hypothetical protein Tco_0461570 [Tanacetum coccineum]
MLLENYPPEQSTNLPTLAIQVLCAEYGREKQTNPQGSARTTSTVDLKELCEKHYERLLPIMEDKYEYERRKKEKLEEVKAWLDFGEAQKKSTRAQESAYSESRTMSPRRQRRSCSPRHNPNVFTRLRCETVTIAAAMKYKSKAEGKVVFKDQKQWTGHIRALY